MEYGKKLLLSVCLGGLVLVIAYLLIVFWYISHPKPYDNRSIIASFDFIEIYAYRYLSFHYTLENKSDEDFRMDGITILSKEKTPTPPHENKRTEVRINLPIFIPAKHKQNIQLYTNEEFDMSDVVGLGEQEIRADCAKLVRKQLPNLNGFLIYNHRYAIELPRGW